MARGALLVALMFGLGWHRRRGKVETAFPLAATLAGGALASLALNGHAAAGEGVAGAVRLAAGLVHLLAAGGWNSRVLLVLGMLLPGLEAFCSGCLISTPDFVYDFFTLGGLLFAVAVVFGIVP